MVVIVCYDIKTDSPGGPARLRKVALTCERYGTRVQNSVFELDVTPADLSKLKIELASLVDDEIDSIRIYRLGKNAGPRTTVIGCVNRIEMGAALIF